MIVVFSSGLSDDTSVDLRIRVTDTQGRVVKSNGELCAFYDRYDDGRSSLPISPNVNYPLGNVGSLRNTRDTVGIALTLAAGRAETIVVHVVILIAQEVVSSEAVTFIANPGSWESMVSIRYR